VGFQRFGFRYAGISRARGFPGSGGNRLFERLVYSKTFRVFCGRGKQRIDPLLFTGNDAVCADMADVRVCQKLPETGTRKLFHFPGNFLHWRSPDKKTKVRGGPAIFLKLHRTPFPPARFSDGCTVGEWWDRLTVKPQQFVLALVDSWQSRAPGQADDHTLGT